MDQAIIADPADIRRLVNVVVFAIDGDRAFRGIERDAAGGAFDVIHGETLRLLDHLLPQVHGGVGGFHGIRGRPVMPVPGFEILHEGPVFPVAQSLVVVPCGQLAFDVVRADRGDLFFRDGHGDDGKTVRLQTRRLVFLEERDVGITVQRVDHGVSPRGLELIDDGAEVRGTHRRVFLSDDLHAIVFRIGAHDAVRCLREHIIGSHKEQPSAALLLEIVESGNDLLVRRRTRIEDIGASLHAFILQRIEQQRIVCFEHRLHGFAGRGSPSAEHRRHAVLFDQGLGFLREHRRFGLAVLLHDFQFLAEHTALGVDLIDRHMQRIGHGLLREGHGAAQRVHETDGDALCAGIHTALRGSAGAIGFHGLSVGHGAAPATAAGQGDHRGEHHSGRDRSHHSQLRHTLVPLSHDAQAVTCPFIPTPFARRVALVFPKRLTYDVFVNETPKTLCSQGNIRGWISPGCRRARFRASRRAASASPGTGLTA